MQENQAKKVDIYLPYYFSLGTLFSERFLNYSIKQMDFCNGISSTIYREQHSGKVYLTARCKNIPEKCPFKLRFAECFDESKARGFELVNIISFHSCKNFSPLEQKSLLKQRKDQIRRYSGQILQILEERMPRYGCEPSRDIMSYLAVRVDQPPNFLVKGVSRLIQKQIRKRFDNQIIKFRRKVNEKLKLEQQLEQFMQRIESSEQQRDDSSFQTSLKIKKKQNSA